MDSKGEIIRVGEPRSLIEGKFSNTEVDLTRSNIADEVASKKSNDSMVLKSTLRKTSPSIPAFNKIESYVSKLNLSLHGSSEFPIESDAFDLLQDRISMHEKIVEKSRPRLNSNISSSSLSNHNKIQQNQGLLHLDLSNHSHQSSSLAIRNIDASRHSIASKKSYTINQVPFDYSNHSITSNPQLVNYKPLSTLYESTRSLKYFPMYSGELVHDKDSSLLLESGIEIRSYSLVTNSESTSFDLLNRSVSITSSPLPYDPKIDLVGKDLSEIPAVISSIEKAWESQDSIEKMSGVSLAENLIESMKSHTLFNRDVFDLIITGVEVSLWIAEQFAADLRTIFPKMNILTTSANKLLSVGDVKPGNVFFPGKLTYLMLCKYRVNKTVVYRH